MVMERARRWSPVVAAVGWAGMIFYFSSLNHAVLIEGPIWDFITRKAAHVFVFGVEAALVATAAAAFLLPRPALIGLAVAVAYGAVDEFHQGFVAGRSAAVTDVLIDSVGALIGVATWSYLARRQGR